MLAKQAQALYHDFSFRNQITHGNGSFPGWGGTAGPAVVRFGRTAPHSRTAIMFATMFTADRGSILLASRYSILATLVLASLG
jgi:hypothetical protein